MRFQRVLCLCLACLLLCGCSGQKTAQQPTESTTAPAAIPTTIPTEPPTLPIETETAELELSL